MIKDSGDRTEFETGAKRDMHAGKGRMGKRAIKFSVLIVWPRSLKRMGRFAMAYHGECAFPMKKLS